MLFSISTEAAIRSTVLVPRSTSSTKQSIGARPSVYNPEQSVPDRLWDWLKLRFQRPAETPIPKRFATV